MKFILAAIGLSFLAGAAFAQGDRGTITGTVSDPAGAVVASAAIEAKLRKTYAPGCGPQQSRSRTHDAAPVPMTQV